MMDRVGRARLDERKIWFCETANGPRATCSDCAWTHSFREPAANARELAETLFGAHHCSDHPKSHPFNPSFQEQRESYAVLLNSIGRRTDL